MWSDSTTVLQWIHSLDKQPVFVANRMAEILDLTTTDEWNYEWNYVKSSENPADAGTRVLSAKSLVSSSWLNGPEFLKTSDWPFKPSEPSKFKLKPDFNDQSTEKPSPKNEVVLNSNADINTSTFEWHKYSSFEKLLCVVAYLMRLIPKNEAYRSKTCTITDPSELENAQTKLFCLAQSESFPIEKKLLLKNSPLSRSSKLLQFSLFIGPNGLLRATGRTKQLDVSSFDAKHPVLLDSRHPVTRLFLEQLHRAHCHQSVDYLRALVQQQFAIVKLRTALRSIVQICVTCRKRRA